MDAFQYFYEDGEVVGKAPVGELEFDARDEHDHWHFKQFAAYSLLDADGDEVLDSRKEAFCLASTDAIDLTLPGVDLNPAMGLSTACGSRTSIWVREILPLGWGDTYFQGLPGQSFDVTGLPNGKYFIRVEANPGGLLHEQSHANNVELREIRLRGPAGDRRVVVPPWNGIDSEAEAGFPF
ncbi:MAG: lysyl oxidase family protein [Actinomycetota bacterium]